MNLLKRIQTRFPVICLVSLGFLFSCGRSNNSKDKPNASCDITGSNYLVSGQDIEYQNSAVSCIDLASGSTELLLESSSSDAILKKTSNHQYFFFERTPKLNGASAFEIVFSENSASIKEQMSGQKLEGFDARDPHDIVQYGKDKFLLAGFSSHSLSFLDYYKSDSLSLTASIWNLDTDTSKFRPTQILKIKERIFVLHQSYKEEEYLKPAGKSKIFVFDVKDSESKLIPLDLNLETKNIQGIDLEGTFPNKIWYLEKQDLIGVYSLCASFVDNRNQCKDSIEFYSTKTLTVQPELRIDIPKKYSMNGSEIGASSNHLYVNVKETREKQNLSAILEINLQTKSISTFFVYPEGTTSSHGIYFDQTNKKVLFGIGDVKSKKGMLCELSNGIASSQSIHDAKCSSKMNYIPGQIYPL